MENISILNKKDCTGCRMCEQICPVNAIKMVENKEGFIEPVVDEEKCINCGLCAKRCPQLNNVKDKRQEKIKVYAAKNKNIEEQKHSSSGGIFSIFANYIIENNGVIYGCAFNEKFEAQHIRIENKEELVKLRGSKYVQSNTRDTFSQAKKDLENNKLVLYTGTPCQIAGLKSFLGEQYQNLLTIDLICHGVPSQKLFTKYLKYLEEKYKSKIIEYDFRNKEKNPWGLNLKIKFENGKIKYIPARLDPYYKSFLNGDTYRESCYNCKYANTNRIGDITLADYWGIEKEHSEFYDANGVSAIIVSTNIGQVFFDKIKDNIDYIESSIEKVKNKNDNLKLSSKRNEIRNNIYDNLDKKTFKKYMREDLKFNYDIKEVIKNIIPRKIKKIIKTRRLKGED